MSVVQYHLCRSDDLKYEDTESKSLHLCTILFIARSFKRRAQVMKQGRIYGEGVGGVHPPPPEMT